MEKEFVKQLDLWHKKDKHQDIIIAITEVPEAERDYTLVSYLGRALNNEERYEEAIACLQSVQGQGANDPLWHYRLGYAYYYQDQSVQAVEAFEHALRLDPEDRDIQMFLRLSRKDAGIHIDTESDAAESDSQEDQKLSPFKLVTHDSGNISLILSVGSYKREVFASRSEEGFEGNGYDWASLAAVFLEEQQPELAEVIRFDPEADMFVAYTNHKEAMLSFASAFKEACENDVLIHDLFSRAELD
ncbi:Imm51 family immunity protein [Paenibacillus sinopodophylli]|uniref:Imm51 family immunity protein n=1 Tax=Paenibacillus sinopodophylli TaxID=1837342 RepID=UPI00110CF47D|nr:Imm51 family immunity protein [Paenibacillus sinopodophylli]